MFSKKQADIAVKEKNIKAIFLLIASLFFQGAPWGGRAAEISRTALMVLLCGKET
jgi:hypothetical protein